MNPGPVDHEAVEPTWVGDVLGFWFDGLSETHWFGKDHAFDVRIRERFFDLHQRLVTHGSPATATPRAALATVLVMDQFSRNMFRGDPRAYAVDPLARGIARSAIDGGFDAGMNPEERLFLYLPLQHSEDARDQQRALALMQALGRDDWTLFAIAHKHIIDRFGRFPHRNDVLGRVSTPEELELLKDPKASF